MSKISTSKFKTNVEWLSKPSNAIVVGVLAILLIAAVWFVAKKIRAAIASARENANAPQVNEANLTPGLNFTELARRLWDATVAYHSLGSASILVLNMPTGTNEAEVYAVLGTLRTNDDYLALKQAWRNYYDQQGGLSNWVTNAVSTLPGMLNDELNSKELARCRAILEQNGITPDF